MKSLVVIALTLFSFSACASNKKLSTPETVTASAAAVATECTSDLDKLLESIQKAESCYDAAKLAKDCAWGSSADVHLAGAASEVCAKDFASINKQDQKTKANMEKRCSEKYDKAQGSLAQSMRAHCYLGISQFWSVIYSPIEN